MIKKLQSFLQNKRLKLLKSRIANTVKESQELIDLDINAIHSHWQYLKSVKIYDYDELFNACLYSSIVSRDIQLLWKNYSTTDIINEKNLFGRLLYMTLIEFLDDINYLLGKNLRKELIGNNLKEYITELSEINKEFSKVKKKYNSELRNIRNNASAHKTKKGIDLIHFTTKIEFENIQNITVNVSETNIRLTILTTEVIYKLNDQLSIRLEEVEKRLKTLRN